MKALTFANISILSFVMLNIALPTVDVTTDMMMIGKLFLGAWGCVNPRWWSAEHRQWEKCLVDPETFCLNKTIGGLNSICDRSTTGIFAYSCRDPYDWSNDYKDWEACRGSPTSFCSKKAEQEEDAQICQFEQHPSFGISMMIPYLFNYIICFFTWWRLDKTKKRSFFFPMFNFYTQLEAAKVVYLTLTDPNIGQKKKKKYLTEIGLHEVFLEAVPATLILVLILVVAEGSASVGHNTSLKTIIIGDFSLRSTILFVVAFVTSIFSASLGLAKGLLYGVARTIGTGGVLDGLLSGRFIVAFLASGLILISRAFIFALHIMLVDTGKIYVRNAIFLGGSILYLPQLLLALFTTLDFKITSLTILRNHPSLIMLPVFTFFTFSKPHNFCRSEPGDSRVMFSLKYTKINMAISIASYILFCYVMRFTLITESDVFQNYYSLFFWSNFLLFVMTLILAISFMYFDYIFCCCCHCFLAAKQQLSVYDPNHPERKLKLQDGNIVEDKEIDEELRSEIIEMK